MASRNVNTGPITPATRALDAAGVSYEGLPYEHDPSVTSYGDEAAQALGLDPSHVFKTLVVSLDSGSFGVAVVPVSTTADLKAVAAGLGAKKCRLAEPRDVERLTGYVLGGVSPVGTRTALATVVDASAEALATVYVSGGRRGFDIGLAPADLVENVHGRFAPIAR